MSTLIHEAVSGLANALETTQNKFNRAIFTSQPSKVQGEILQNCYNNGMSVKKISTMTGVASSTVYAKIDTRQKAALIRKSV